MVQIILFLSLATSCFTSRFAPPYRITGIQAKLFYHDSATLSADVIEGNDIALWNTPIGEGGAKASSTEMLVIVQVSGKPGTFQAGRRVQLIATEMSDGRLSRRHVILKRTVDVGVLSKSGKFQAAFLLYGTGWVPIKLQARMLGQSSRSAMSKTIDFNSGE